MILFICGIPGAGKSSFGKYLEKNRSFFYLPMEDDIWPDELLHAIWNQIFNSSELNEKVNNFIESVKEKGSKVILDWGFIPEGLHFQIVQLLKILGCRIIWFDCDEEVAKQRFLKRPKSSSIEDFNTQIRNIKNNWDKIVKLINPEIINVLELDKSDKSQEEIYKEIFC